MPRTWLATLRRNFGGPKAPPPAPVAAPEPVIAPSSARGDLQAVPRRFGRHPWRRPVRLRRLRPWLRRANAVKALKPSLTKEGGASDRAALSSLPSSRDDTPARRTQTARARRAPWRKSRCVVRTQPALSRSRISLPRLEIGHPLGRHVDRLAGARGCARCASRARASKTPQSPATRRVHPRPAAWRSRRRRSLRLARSLPDAGPQFSFNTGSAEVPI